MRFAIIDIGYNAIRAVVYEDNTLGAPEIFNNKFKSDVLSLLQQDAFEIKHPTYLTIKYLLHIFKNLNVSEIKCVATAVLRDHPKADDFVNYIKEHYKFNIRILTGDEEARLTTQGLIKGIYNCDGIAADLGGGSLELAEIDNNAIGDLISLELGTKLISRKKITKSEEIVEIIKQEFGEKKYNNLYFIGGALRFIGRLYIDFMNYPIKNLHNLEIDTEDFIKYIKKVESNKKVDPINRSSINQNALLVANAMIEVFRPEKIVISTYGLKEGVRFETVSKQENSKELIEEKVKYACHYKDKTNFENYFNILSPLLPEDENIFYIFKLSIILNSLKHRFDKTLPPRAISEYILSSEIPFAHKTRIMLTLILSYTSTYKPEYEVIKLSKRMLSKQEHCISQIIGYFIRVCEEVDGPIFTNPSFSFILNNHFLEINTADILPRPIFEKVCTRLKSIAYARKSCSN